MLKFEDIASLTVDAIHTVKEEISPHSPHLLHKEGAHEEESEEDRRREKMKEHFDDMLENTSFHGVNYIIDERYPLRRVIWLVITLSAFIYSIMKVYESTVQYLNYPFATARMRHYVDEIEFPHVSLCNLNDMRLSVIEGTLIDQAALTLNDTLLNFVPPEQWETLAKDGPHKIEEILVDCIFNGQKCTHNNFTKFKWSQGDICYTFGTNQLIKGPGVHRGLMLTLNTQHYEYYHDRMVGGFHLMLHGKHQTPLVMQGPMISPGFSTYVQVDKMKIKNLKSPYKTHCGSLKLKYFDEYSIDTCRVEQLTDYVMKNCECKESFMPGRPATCQGNKYMTCVWPKWTEFDDKKLHKCPLPCEIDSYQLKTVSYSLFPSESYGEQLRREMEKLPHMKNVFPKVNDTKRFMRDNLLRLIVFYDDLSYELSEQQPSYDLASFLGDVGGQIGLFVGAGAMSYFELIDCLGLVLNTRFFESFPPKPVPKL